MLFDQPFFYLGMRDSICGCGAVSHDKPRRTELYSSEIAHDTDEDIRQIVAVDLSEDGLAGCRRGLTVIVGTKLLAFCPYHVSIAAVACVIIFLAGRSDDIHSFLHRFYMMSKGEEFTAFVRVVSLADGLFTDG